MASIEEADRILRQHTKPRACYPCAKRKVKCDGKSPCSSCLGRGHPGICISSTHSPPHRHRHRHSRRTRSSAQPSPSPLRSSPAPAPAAPSRPPAAATFLGGIAVPSFLHSAVPASASHDSLRSALGLTNSEASYPFACACPAEKPSALLAHVTPAHADILLYSQLYQTIFAPFYPLVDEDDFEDTVCFYLDRTAAGAQDTTSHATHDPSPPEMARLGLLLAILARGAQLSDALAADRARMSREYNRRAFHCARLANFLGQPSPVAIKCLLVIANVLQNDGQADASWALLGTVARLAEGLGLHRQHAVGDAVPSSQSHKPESLWPEIIRQDCVLSLCFDRTPLNVKSCNAISHAGDLELGYSDYMYALTSWVRLVLEAPLSVRYDAPTVQEHLKSLESITIRATTHIRDINACNTRRKRIEHHVCRLHTSFAVSTTCRPTLYLATRNQNPQRSDDILQRAKHALMETIQAFLDLLTLTNLPTRTWSMIHAALSSAILIEYLGLSSDCPEAQAVLSRFTQALYQQCESPAPGEDGRASLWLSAAQSRMLTVLHSAALAREQEPTSASIRPSASMTVQQNAQMSQPVNNPTGALPSEANISSSHLDETSLLHDSYQVDFSSLPMTELGMFDWDYWGNYTSQGQLYP